TKGSSPRLLHPFPHQPQSCAPDPHQLACRNSRIGRSAETFFLFRLEKAGLVNDDPCGRDSREVFVFVNDFIDKGLRLLFIQIGLLVPPLFSRNSRSLQSKRLDLIGESLSDAGVNHLALPTLKVMEGYPNEACISR